MATIEERLKKIITYQFEIEDKAFVPRARLVEDFNASSLDLIEIDLAISQEFQRPIGEMDVRDISTIGGIVAYLKKHVQE